LFAAGFFFTFAVVLALGFAGIARAWATPTLADALGAALREEMENVYKLSVPLEVDIGVGENWADA
jgi:hypothetical protein